MIFFDSLSEFLRVEIELLFFLEASQFPPHSFNFWKIGHFVTEFYRCDSEVDWYT